ncbi:MAG TPA: DUF1697 domain-containing protein [Pyrinomonadaceae bacterium]|nr:DUF1697 domain-containing protein [Pyrinomonadaceae bacterium]
MTRYVALLRAINVGGKNLLKMDALRNAFESAGLKNVRTFQQAGNVVFEATRIKKNLFQTLNLKTDGIVLSLTDLKQIIDRDPFKKVAAGDVMLCVVFFVDRPANSPKLPLLSPTENLELIAITDLAAFVVARRRKTGWFGFPNNFVEKELGVTATTRQWSTVKKLLAFAEKD